MKGNLKQIRLAKWRDSSLHQIESSSPKYQTSGRTYKSKNFSGKYGELQMTFTTTTTTASSLSH